MRLHARRTALRGKTPEEMLVSEIMSAPVITARLQQTAQECLMMMGRNHIRHLPVVEQGQVVGLVSIGDVALAIIAEQEEALQRLEDATQGRELLE